MVELIAYGQKPLAANAPTGEMFVLDLANPGALSLTYEISKGEEIMGRYSPYSQTFRLPFSNGNSEFFGHFYDVNIQPLAIVASDAIRFNVHQKCYAEIRVDGIPIIQGSLQLKNVHLKEEEYEVVVFGQEANLFQDISDKKLADLFISNGVQNTDYDVALSDANVVDSFDLSNDVTQGTVGAGTVIIPIIDYGHISPQNFLYYESNQTSLSGMAVANFLEPYMLKPAISVDKLFRLIFNQAGYTLTSTDFLTSDAWTKLYMTLASDRESVATRGVLGVCVGATGPAEIATWTNTTGPDTNVIPFDNESGSGVNSNPPLFYDAGNNWNSTLYEFVAPEDGYYFGELHCRFDCTSLSGVTNASVMIGVHGSLGTQPGQPSSNDTLSYWQGLQGGSISTKILPWSVYLNAGETMTATADVNVWGGGSVDLTKEGTFLIIQASQLTNGIMSMANNMPNMLQTDFIKDLVQRFNLCIVSDKDNPSALTIQPWQDYLDAGTHKDWTDRLDLSKARKITPTDALRKKYIELGDAEDPSVFNANFQDNNGYVLGTYKQEIGDDFTSGTMSNTSQFAPFQVKPIPRSDFGVSTDVPDFLILRDFGQDIDGPIKDAKPKLFYHNGLKTLNNGNSFFVGEQESTSYPLCLPFYNNGSPMDADSPMLYWNFEVPEAFNNPTFGAEPSQNGYFQKYHQQFLLSIYDDDARLFECSMMLSATDIFNFKFNDEIQIENTPYRVLKISGYQPFEDVPCQVQLLKKVNKVGSAYLPDADKECDLNVLGLKADGTVIFVDPTDGTTSTGTEECCNENHYYWDGTDCLWNVGNGGGGGTQSPGKNPNAPSADGKNYKSAIAGFVSKKSISSDRMFNPIQGEHSIRGVNATSSSPSIQKNFVLYATTYSTGAVVATPDGTSNSLGRLVLESGMMCRYVVRALSVQSDNRAVTGSYGSSSFKVFSFMAKNIDGTITTSGGEVSDFAQDDADAGIRRVSIASAVGRLDFNTTDDFGVEISCEGSADRVITWHLDCSATFMSISTYEQFTSDGLLLENMGFILTENNSILEEE